MNMKKLGLLILVAIPVVAAIPVQRIDVVIFHTETCPACTQLVEFLNSLSENYPTMIIQTYDIREEENKVLYDLFKQVYDLDIKGHPVPMVFIGNDSFRGYTATNLKLIEQKMDGCMKSGGCTIALTVERDCIVIKDLTPTPELSVAEFLLPFLVVAGVFSCLNPYNSEVVSKLKTKKSLFLAAYFVTSLLLCFALINVVFVVDTVVFLRIPLVVIAVGMGILSIVSVKVKILKIPESFRNAMDQLIADSSGFSLFSLGIGACILSLVYNAGIYLLVIYRMLLFPFLDRLQNFLIFNVSLIVGLAFLCFAKPERRGVFHVIVGVGGIVLGIFFFMVW